MKKYEEEKNRNKNLTIEIKELNLKYKRIIEEKNKYQKNDGNLIKNDIKNRSNNNSLEMNIKGKDNNFEKIEPKSSTELIKIDKYKNNFSDLEEEKSTKKFSSKIINEMNEDYISISDSLSNENEIINNKTKEIIEKVNDNEKNNNESETISEDNPDLLKEVDKIMNNIS